MPQANNHDVYLPSIGWKPTNLDKHPLVLFSGGLDSTYLISQYLRVGAVDTLSVQANQSEMKQIREEIARKRVIEELGKMSRRYPFTVNREYMRDLNHQFTEVPDYDMVQPISWLTAALIVTDPKIHSEVAIAYLLGDQAPALRQYIDAFWHAGWKLLHWNEPIVPLVFPLLDAGLTKRKILDRIDKQLVSHVWSCELPSIRPGEGVYFSWADVEEAKKDPRRLKACGKCLPCRLMKHTLADYKEDNDESYSTAVIKHLNPAIYPGISKEIPKLENDKEATCAADE